MLQGKKKSLFYLLSTPIFHISQQQTTVRVLCKYLTFPLNRSCTVELPVHSITRQKWEIPFGDFTVLEKQQSRKITPQSLPSSLRMIPQNISGKQYSHKCSLLDFLLLENFFSLLQKVHVQSLYGTCLCSSQGCNFLNSPC